MLTHIALAISIEYSNFMTANLFNTLKRSQVSETMCWFLFFRLIALPSPGLNFLKSCIAMEAGLVSEGNGDALKQLRKLFNLAVELYGHFDEGLWLEYCSQERKVMFNSRCIYMLYPCQLSLWHMPG